MGDWVNTTTHGFYIKLFYKYIKMYKVIFSLENGKSFIGRNVVQFLSQKLLEKSSKHNLKK